MRRRRPLREEAAIEPTSPPHILVQAATAKPLFAAQDSFWAKSGKGGELRLFYQGKTPADRGEELLRFEVREEGLLLRPDGNPFQPGDSILITVTVRDPSRFLFDFQPAGLRFNPSDPARLTVYYYNADHDFNGDGKTDATDARITGLLDIWRRELPDTLWFRLGAANFESDEELDAKIRTFTDYAIAW